MTMTIHIYTITTIELSAIIDFFTDVEIPSRKIKTFLNKREITLTTAEISGIIKHFTDKDIPVGDIESKYFNIKKSNLHKK